MDTPDPGDAHTQKAPLCLIVYGAAIAMLVGTWCADGERPIALILTGSGMVMCLLASAFHHLTAVDEGEVLAIRFGPIPLEPIVFKADHPFLSFIQDRKTNPVLFSGRVLDPQ